MNKIFFKEEQQFRQWWHIVFILAVTIPVMVMSIYTLYMQTVKGIQVGNTPAPNYVMVITFFGMCAVLWVNYVTKLEVQIDQDGIHYRFFPMIFRQRFISKQEIQRYEIRKYSPILDYGGWGLRRGIGRKWGKALIISGNMGLQLYLTSGKKVLFGTQRSQAIKYAMDEMMKSETRK